MRIAFDGGGSSRIVFILSVVIRLRSSIANYTMSADWKREFDPGSCQNLCRDLLLTMRGGMSWMFSGTAYGLVYL